MNGKTKKQITIGGVASAIVLGGLVIGTVQDLRWWPWRWEHHALAEDVARQDMRLAENVQTNKVAIVEIKLGVAFSERVQTDAELRKCELETPTQCTRLRKDQAILMNEEVRLRKKLDRLLSK